MNSAIWPRICENRVMDNENKKLPIFLYSVIVSLESGKNRFRLSFVIKKRRKKIHSKLCIWTLTQQVSYKFKLKILQYKRKTNDKNSLNFNKPSVKYELNDFKFCLHWTFEKLNLCSNINSGWLAENWHELLKITFIVQ